MLSARLKRLGGDTLVYGLGGILSKFAGLFLLPIYTRVFSPHEYGIIEAITTLCVLGALVLTAGTDSALSYYFFKYADAEEQCKTVTACTIYVLMANTFVALIILCFAHPICIAMFGDTGYEIYLRIAAIGLPFSSVANVQRNLLRLQRKPWIFLGASIPFLLISITLNILLIVVMRVGVIGVFFTMSVTSILAALGTTSYNYRFFSLAFDTHRLCQLLRYGSPLVMGGLGMWCISFLDRFFLLKYNAIDDLGVYAVGLRLASVVGLATLAFRRANLAFQYEISNQPDAREVYGKTPSYFIVIMSLICVPLSLFSAPFLRIVTTKAYVDAALIVPLAAYSAVVYGLYQMVAVGLRLTERTILTGCTIGMGAVLNVLYLMVLVPRFGIVGAASATLATHITVVSVLYVSAQRYYLIPYEVVRCSRTLLCAGVIITLGSLTRSGALLADVAIGTVLSLLFVSLIPTLELLDPAMQRMINSWVLGFLRSARILPNVERHHSADGL